MTFRRTAGLSHISWLHLGLWLLVILTFVLREWPLTLIALGLNLSLRILTQRARQNGYATFTPLVAEPDAEHIPVLPGYKRLPVRATGLFSAGQQEHYVLLRPAECWHIPVDEHTIMVERGAGRFLYQFVEPEYLERVRIGHFLFGESRFPSLEITFSTDWSPQLDDSGLAYFVGGGKNAVGRLRRKIYLAFEEEEPWLLMWKSLVKR